MSTVGARWAEVTPPPVSSEDEPGTGALPQRQAILPQQSEVRTTPAKKKAPAARNPDQRELRALPGKIEKLEAQIEAMHQRFAGEGYYQQDAELIRDDQQKLQALDTELAQLYERWEELEG